MSGPCKHMLKSSGPCSQCLGPTVRRIAARHLTIEQIVAESRARSADAKLRAKAAAAGGRARARKVRARRPVVALVTKSLAARERISNAASSRWEALTGMTSAERATKIKQLREQGLSYKAIAAAVPCGHRTVQRVIRGY